MYFLFWRDDNGTHLLNFTDKEETEEMIARIISNAGCNYPEAVRPRLFTGEETSYEYSPPSGHIVNIKR